MLEYGRARTVIRISLDGVVLLILLAMLPVAYAQYEKQPCVGCVAAEAIGAQKTIVVLVEFQDVKHSVTREVIHSRIFNEMNAYFREMSYGKTWLEGDTTQWYQMPNPLSYYSVSPFNMKVDKKRVEALVTDAANAADKDVNFSEYSRAIVIVGAATTAGKGYGMTGYAAMPGMLGNRATIQTKSGEVIKNAIVAAENVHVGIIAHDYAHMLGGAVGKGRPIQDLYDYDLQSTPGKLYGYAQFYHTYMGYWDIMSAHIIQWDLPPPGMSSFTKMRLGWIPPSQIAVVQPAQIASVKLEPLEEKTSGILATKIPLTSTAYYLLENRQQVGYDAVLPGSGVLVLYVDESVADGSGPVRVVSNKTISYPKDVSFLHGRGKNVAKEVPYLNDAPLDMKNPLFTDPKNNISIRLLNKVDSSYVVQVAPIGEPKKPMRPETTVVTTSPAVAPIPPSKPGGIPGDDLAPFALIAIVVLAALVYLKGRRKVQPTPPISQKREVADSKAERA